MGPFRLIFVLLLVLSLRVHESAAAPRPPFIGIWNGNVQMQSGAGPHATCATNSCSETCSNKQNANLQTLAFSTNGANISASLSYNGFPLGTCTNNGVVTSWNSSGYIEVDFDCGQGNCFNSCPPSPFGGPDKPPSVPVCFYYQSSGKTGKLAFSWILESCPASSGFHPPPGCPTSLATFCQVLRNGCWLTKIIMTPQSNDPNE